MVLPGLERSLFTFSIQHERQTWKGYERQLVIKATNLTEKAARMSRVHTSSVISGLGNFFPPGWIPAESSELYAVGLLGWDQTVWLWPVDAVARDLFASKRTPFNGNLFQRWKLIEANIVAYHSCDGTESVKHSTDLIWFSDLVSSVGAEKGIFHVLPSELFLKWTVRASGTLRQSSVKATIGQGGAYIEDGEYVGAWAVQRTKPWSFEHANMWRLFGDLKLGTSFPAWEGLHSVNFVDRWPLGRATATFHGRVMHHCYEWRSSQFPCKMQDIARSLAWSVCVIETDRRWRCLADWNGWTFRNPIVREGQSHSAGHRSTQDWSLCRKSMLFTLHQPRIRSRYIQTCCIRTFFFVRFSIFKRTLAVCMLG